MIRAASAISVGVCLLGALATAGCAAEHSSRFIRRGKSDASARQTRGPHAQAASEEPLPILSPKALQDFIEQVRHLSAAARPKPTGDAKTVESGDRELSAARQTLAAAPTAANHRRVAESYLRLRVLDAAYDQFHAAIRLEPSDASSYDGLARVWRDWGLPGLGLSDAYHAVYYAPASSIPLNTLGTLLLKSGQPAAARQAFEKALQLDPDAAFALNNLCYTLLLQGDAARAVDRCARAVAAAPALVAAHNNLGLAYTAAGNRTAAAAEFAHAGSPAAQQYNLGVALFATGQFADAADAFDTSAALNPSQSLARVRERQAKRHAETAGTP